MFSIKLLAVFIGFLSFANGLPIEEGDHGIEAVPIGVEHTFLDNGFQEVNAGHIYIEPETGFHGVDAGHTLVETEFQGVDSGHIFVEPDTEFHVIDIGHIFVEPEIEFHGVDAGLTFVEPEPEPVPEEQKSLDKDAENDGRTPSTIYFESIPASERPVFLRYHLAMALKDTDSYNPYVVMMTKESHNFETEVAAPDNFTMNLYQWIKNHYGITDTDLYNFVTFGQICFPSGTCIDPEDVGAICCPF